MGSENLDNSDSFVASVGKSVSAKLKGILHSVLGTAKETIPIAGKGATDVLAALDIVNRPTFKRELPSKPMTSDLEVPVLKEDSVKEPQEIHEEIHEETEEQISELFSEPLVAENLQPEAEGIVMKPLTDGDDRTEVQMVVEADVSVNEDDTKIAEEEKVSEIPVAEDTDDADEEKVDEIEASSDPEDAFEKNSYKAPQTAETSAACAERSCTGHIFDPDAYMWGEEETNEVIIDSDSITRTEPMSAEESSDDNIVQLSSEENLAEEAHIGGSEYIPNIIQVENSFAAETFTEVEAAEVTYLEIEDEVEGLMKIVVPEVSEDEIETEDSFVSEIETEETDDYSMAFSIARTEFPLADVAVEEYVPIFSFRSEPTVERITTEDSTETLKARDYVENVVADDIVNRILVDLVPEIFEEPKTVDILPEVREDPAEAAMIADIIEDIVAETVVNDIMVRLVPEVFAVTEMIAKDDDPAVVSEAVEDIDTEVSTETAIKSLPKKTAETVGTTINFIFPFATMSLNDGTGFRFIMGASDDIENDLSTIDEMSDLDSNDSSESIYVAPVRSGSTFTL